MSNVSDLSKRLDAVQRRSAQTDRRYHDVMRRHKQQSEPEAEPQPAMMTVRVMLTLTVDGKPIVNAPFVAPFVAEVPRPEPDQIAQFQLALDGRELATAILPELLRQMPGSIRNSTGTKAF